MYKYYKTHRKSSHICERENRSLLRKGRQRGQKSVLTELDWASPRQSSETAERSERSEGGRKRRRMWTKPREADFIYHKMKE
jgi:hypothetical protein